MNWYKGNIAEAVAETKARNAIFVVYIEGTDISSTKLTNFLNVDKIRQKLESDQFVAIKIQSDSEAYLQFASIYQMVPVPSIFFIGKSGAPLEVGTGVIATVDELDRKIDNALGITVMGATTASGSSSFIAGERASTSSASTAAVAPAEAATVELAESKVDQSYDVVCEDGVCFKKPRAPVAAPQEQPEPVATPMVVVAPPEKLVAPSEESVAMPDEVIAPSEELVNEPTEESLEHARKLLEQKRRERVEAEKQLEKEQELRRRRELKEVQKLQDWRKEQEYKEAMESRRRERLEEQAARGRILAQIAADRAEQAHKFTANVEDPSAAAAQPKPVASSPQSASGAESTRIQFRFSNGDTHTHVFSCQDQLSAVRSYVTSELLPGTGIRDFMLATTYPKRELSAEHEEKTLVELELFPSAVILVISKESTNTPSAIIARSGGLLNIVAMLLKMALSPFYAVYNYLSRPPASGGGSPNANAATENLSLDIKREAAAKRRKMSHDAARAGVATDGGQSTSSPDTSEEPSTLTRRGRGQRRYGGSNIHRLTDNRVDSDDENATWNGNSTQQQ